MKLCIRIHCFLWPITYSSCHWMDDWSVQCECVYVYVCVWILHITFIDM